MQHPYQDGVDSKIAVVPVTLPNGVQIPAKLDTGAELCCIYDGYILAQDPDQVYPVARRRFSGLTGGEWFTVYSMVLLIGTREFRVMVVAGKESRNVIGMNVLNEIVSSFDGPAALVNLTL